MNDFQVKSDAVDVDAIMRQIRARIREKRGADYTEAEVQELAKVKLEQFLDPKGVRSDLVAQFRRHRTVSPAPPNYKFEDDTIYETHRGFLRSMRKLLNPILKLFFNPNKISEALHVQAKVNQEFHQRFRQREDMDPLYYELVHNLALEVTRLGIEVHNMKMRVESVSSRMDFDERRGRALESVVQYRQPRPQQNQRPQHQQQQQPPQSQQPSQAQATDPTAAALPVTGAQPGTTTPQGPPQGAPQSGQQGDRPEGDGDRRRRRRRRRRRPGQTMGDQAAGPSTEGPVNGAVGSNGNGTARWVAEGGAEPDTDDDDDADDSGPSDDNAQ
jgi:hypothetical protein